MVFFSRSAFTARQNVTVRIVCVLVAAFFILAPHPAAAGPTIIRDAEIENTLADFTRPVFDAAGIGVNDVNIILVEDNNLNAFVAGGMNIFIYTGVILEAENPSELIGVLAHETGHIAGAHLIRTRAAMEQASFQTLLASLLGVAAAVGSGDGGAGAAVMTGTQSMAYNSMLSHSRTQEASADQAAVKYLDDAGLNADGLLTFLEKLQNQEALPSSQQVEYVRTHPLTRNRISYLRKSVEDNTRSTRPNPEWEARLKRIQAKLTGFIYPDQGLRMPRDTIAGRYGHTIALYRKNRLNEALTGINGLIKEETQNPYFHELKGQMLYESGRIKDSIPPYEEAVSLLPKSSLLRLHYGQALLAEADSAEGYKNAINQLERSISLEKRQPLAHRLLATAYGRIDQEGTARVHLAEEAVLRGQYTDARRHIGLAEKSLDKSSSKWLRLQDLKKYLQNIAPEDK